MFGIITQIQNQAQVQYDQNQNQINQILAQAEMQRASAEKREEAQRAEALKREEMCDEVGGICVHLGGQLPGADGFPDRGLFDKLSWLAKTNRMRYLSQPRGRGVS